MLRIPKTITKRTTASSSSFLDEDIASYLLIGAGGIRLFEE
jgi:hypothetical protein